MGVVSVSSVIKKMFPYLTYNELIYLAIKLASGPVIGK